MSEQTGLALRTVSAASIQAQAKEWVPVLRELIVNGKRLTDEQIQGRAMFAAAEGLNPITEVQTLVDRDGKTMGQMMAMTGYRRKCQEEAGFGVDIHLEFIAISKAELPQGAAYGYECRLRDGQSYTNWQKRLVEVGKAVREAMGTQTLDYATLSDICGPAPLFTGIGIFWTSEFNEFKDRNYPPQERAKKRAERNARTKRFSIEAPMYEGGSTSPIIAQGDTTIEGTFSETPSKPVRTADQITGEIMNDIPSPALANSPEPTEQPSSDDEQPGNSLPEWEMTSNGQAYDELDSEEIRQFHLTPLGNKKNKTELDVKKIKYLQGLLAKRNGGK